MRRRSTERPLEYWVARSSRAMTPILFLKMRDIGALLPRLQLARQGEQLRGAGFDEAR
jgi:hypothetical protein